MVRYFLILAALTVAASTASADERHFAYSLEAEGPHKGDLEFVQWLSHRAGKRGGSFSRWDVSEEIEYGITDKLGAALYLNFRDTYSSGVTGQDDVDNFKFKGVSTELKYQILSPEESPVGLMAYGEATYDGEDLELEAKMIASAELSDSLVVALNAAYEPEWTFADASTEREASVEFSGGIAAKLCEPWSVGLELKSNQAYSGGHDLKGQEYNALFLGPNVSYHGEKLWGVFAVLPQVWGNGEGALGNLQASERERLEARLLVGTSF